MTYEAEVPKEFLRKMYREGFLDITGSYEHMAAFVSIFAGELEALIACQEAGFLSEKEQDQLFKLSAPTHESKRHYEAWLNRISTTV